MFLLPGYFKRRTLLALKGQWQIALLVCFIQALPSLLVTALQNRLLPLPDVLGRTVAEVLAPYASVPSSTWWLLGGLQLLAEAIVCVLMVGRCHYFVDRLQGGQGGLGMLFSRLSLTLRILWLNIIMTVKVLLWSLLLLVPGYIAALRYSMAPYYLAEDPTLTAMEAIEKSKNAMKETKMSLFALQVSFLGWVLLSQVLSVLLDDATGLAGTIVGLLCSVVISTYMSGAQAGFFLTVSQPGAAQRLAGDPGAMLRELESQRDTSGDDDGEGE